MPRAGSSARADPRSRWRGAPRLETWVMAAAVAALIVLVVLPLLFLLAGSFRGEEGASLEHFGEALTGRLYTQALANSLVLGAWTGLFSLAIGLPMAWAVCRTNVPAPVLFRVTASLSYLSPPFLTAIAALAMVSMAITSLALLAASWLASRRGSVRAGDGAVAAGARG